MSSRRRRSPCWRAAVGDWSRLPASWASRPRCCATGAIARGAASGVGGARETGVGHALRCGSGGRDLPASPRERSAAPGARHFRKGCGDLLGSAEMRFRLIEDQRSVWPVRVLCDALGVSPLGYYAWRSRPESPREIANRELPSDIRRVHAEHRGRYGGPRIHAELRAAGQSVSRKPIERVMRRHGIRAHVPPRSRVCTTHSKHSLPIAAALLDRNFVAEKPDQSLPRQRPGSGWRISPISRPARAGSTWP